MLCRYELLAEAICPVDPKVRDKYRLTIESVETIMVEDIEALTTRLESRKITQEDLSQEIAAAFPAATITTVGWHSGIKTTVIIEPPG